MAFAIDVIGWIGAGVLIYAYWLVSTQKSANSLWNGAYPSVGVNAVWIAIGLHALRPRPRSLRS